MTAPDIVRLVAAVAGGGTLVALIQWGRERWRRRQPAEVESVNLQATAQALATVSKARDELEADNGRLRQQLADERSYYLAEIDRIRTQLMDALAEIDQIRSGIRHEPAEETPS
ncbi:hypothetical protein CLV30_13152 [Haloactinopolyspora alba]|uniref:Uncharacterized protein n=1 Tax=Haloactinopolyspora alba TaxID=648780 RepID=A0A2P8D711_9ACTN|nr:hypothetical protein [Haloactinopolyspora alba]PSK93025.1 hypothetical protein CLV30_13152 [Haloactinopolyspora alba]